MHKVYLNKSELSLIEGSDAIVNKIGCFPSMENCAMDEIRIYVLFSLYTSFVKFSTNVEK